MLLLLLLYPAANGLQLLQGLECWQLQQLTASILSTLADLLLLLLLGLLLLLLLLGLLLLLLPGRVGHPICRLVLLGAVNLCI
jgi:hypothetical protein